MIYKQKRAWKPPFFFTVFGYFVRLWRNIWPLHHHPRAGHYPRQQSARQAVLEPPAQSLALSKCRPGAFRLRPRHDVSPPSLLLVTWKSYTTPSRTTTSIYIAALFRVNPNLHWYEYYYFALPVSQVCATHSWFICQGPWSSWQTTKVCWHR